MPRATPTFQNAETAIVVVEHATPHGTLWSARATYPDTYRHGRTAVATGRVWDPQDLSRVTREPRAGTVAPDRWLMLDVESTGLGARAGTYAFLVGLGYWDQGAYVVEQLLMRDPADEPALLHVLCERLAAFDGLATFNGKSFDMPLLATRAAMAQRPWPHAALIHCDLLHAARRIWSTSEGCRLALLESRWLGVRRRHDVAGRDVPELYLAYLRDGDPAGLDAVLRHNRADILSLQLVTAHAARFLALAAASSAPNTAAAAADRLCAARVYAAAGEWPRAAELFGGCITAEAAPAVRQTARALLAQYRKRAGEILAACDLWQEMLADEPDAIEPYEELAKAFEHRLQDPAGAFAWVERRLGGGALAAAQVAQFAHRRQRLARKLGSTPALWPGAMAEPATDDPGVSPPAP